MYKLIPVVYTTPNSSPLVPDLERLPICKKYVCASEADTTAIPNNPSVIPDTPSPPGSPLINVHPLPPPPQHQPSQPPPASPPRSPPLPSETPTPPS